MMRTQKIIRGELSAIKEKILKERALKEGEKSARVTVHMGTCGIASGADKVLAGLEAAVRESGRKDIVITTSGCVGLCSMEPLITVERFDMAPVVYCEVDEASAAEIFTAHVEEGRVLAKKALAEGAVIDAEKGTAPAASSAAIPHVSEMPFFSMQKSLVLSNRGVISPDDIDEYISRDGYQAVAKALLDMTPKQIVDEVKASGLRGRGGGGFPTGVKWTFAAGTENDTKYVLCNADEGDPGAFMDRSVMEGDPHKVIEGMIIAARAIGSHQGYIYCRAEYPLALEKLGNAIEQATEKGLLGKDILGSGFDFNLEIYMGAGAFVCGEETALIASIQGMRGTPRPRPPFPAVSGLWQKPTILNNVETYANVPGIILQGSDAFSGIGTAGSKGTKVFALTGKVRRTGLVEVPMGTSLGDIIYNIGGGIPGDKPFKAAQLGGPSGGCIPAKHLNTKTDYDAIMKAGAIMGSGGLIVMDHDTCMVDMARYFMEFCQDESCGKCTPCRVGTKRMLQILERICAGEGRDGDIELLIDLAHTIKDTALCGLGQTAPNPVLSTLENFRHEYEAHIYDKHCEAAACTKMFKSPCQHTCPVGMDIPTYLELIQANCLDEAWEVLKETNPFPSVCGRVCSHPCEAKCRRGDADAPVAIRDLKRYITDHANRLKQEPIPITRKERIAVVGGGPSGLTAAYELKKRGYAVTVLDDKEKPGGMLRYGIPSFRLPREVLDAEIQDLLDTGIELKSGTCVGKDVTMASLVSDFDAVYLAVGAHESWTTGTPGEDAEGVLGAVAFLKDVNAGKRVAVGKNVVVVGGGLTAMDAARTARRLGAEKVTVAYRRTLLEMPVPPEELTECAAENIRVMELVAPTAYTTDNGRVTGVSLGKMVLGAFDDSGRRRPILSSEEGELIPADTVIMAIGNKADLAFVGSFQADLVAKNRIVVTRGGRTTHDQIFAGGDIIDGSSLVIEAIRDGQKSASAIDSAIRAKNGEPPWRAPARKRRDVTLDPVEGADQFPRTPLPEQEPNKRIQNFEEVGLGYTAEMARKEASRCLRCHLNAEAPSAIDAKE
jgi:NADH-quinone oxidoreductase subunit F